MVNVQSKSRLKPAGTAYMGAKLKSLIRIPSSPFQLCSYLPVWMMVGRRKTRWQAQVIDGVALGQVSGAAGGYDFVGGDFTGKNDVEYSDPLVTCMEGGHGTHVSGRLSLVL
jgi:hypothetical protein